MLVATDGGSRGMTLRRCPPVFGSTSRSMPKTMCTALAVPAAGPAVWLCRCHGQRARLMAEIEKLTGKAAT